MVREYKSFSTEKKLKVIRENLISRAEHEAYSKYINALENDDIETVKYFESFGNDSRRIITNYRCFNRNLLFGFDTISYDECGWMERPVFLDKEEIVIYVNKNGWKDENKIEVARGNNGKWTNGIWAQTNTGGNVDGISVWGEIFDTKESAIVGACNRIINFHKEKSWNGSNKVIELALAFIETTRRPVQLSLF